MNGPAALKWLHWGGLSLILWAAVVAYDTVRGGVLSVDNGGGLVPAAGIVLMLVGAAYALFEARHPAALRNMALPIMAPKALNNDL